MPNVKRLVKEPVATPYNKILPVVQANWRLGVGGSQVQSQPRLLSDFKASLRNSVRPCLKIKRTKRAGWRSRLPSRVLFSASSRPGFNPQY